MIDNTAALRTQFNTVVSGSSGPCGEAGNVARRLIREPAECWPALFRTLAQARSGRGSAPGDGLMSLLRPMAVWALAYPPNDVYALLGEQGALFWSEWDKWVTAAVAPVLSIPEPAVPPDPGPAPVLPPHPGPALPVFPQSTGGLRARIRSDVGGTDSLYGSDDGPPVDSDALVAWRSAIAAYTEATVNYQAWQQAHYAYNQAKTAHASWAANRTKAQRWACTLRK